MFKNLYQWCKQNKPNAITIFISILTIIVTFAFGLISRNIGNEQIAIATKGLSSPEQSGPNAELPGRSKPAGIPSEQSPPPKTASLAPTTPQSSEEPRHPEFVPTPEKPISGEQSTPEDDHSPHPQPIQTPPPTPPSPPPEPPDIRHMKIFVQAQNSDENLLSLANKFRHGLDNGKFITVTIPEEADFIAQIAIPEVNSFPNDSRNTTWTASAAMMVTLSSQKDGAKFSVDDEEVRSANNQVAAEERAKDAAFSGVLEKFIAQADSK